MPNDNTAQSLDYGLGLLLRRAQAAVAGDFTQRFAADNIRAAQYTLLRLLRDRPGLAPTRVGAALGVRRTNFVPLFDGLERRGLAERRRVPGDRRAMALFLSDAGEALLLRLEAVAAAHEAEFTARLGSSAARTALIDLLGRLERDAEAGA